MYCGPDSPDANKLGCKCPVGGNGHGAGLTEDGVTSWRIGSECPIHTKALWWMRPPRPPPPEPMDGVNGR